MPSYRFVHVDVFTAQPFGGNPLAVFTDARGMSAATMQTLAREMNYSESAFVLPAELPGAARRVRIFTPAYEMPFAGHPTIGTTFVLASEGAIELTGETTDAQLQLNIGLMPVTISAVAGRPRFVWMEQRAADFGPAWANAAEVAAAIGVEAHDLAADSPIQIVSTGVPYLIVPVRSLEAMRRARPDGPALRRLLAGQDELLTLYLFTHETADPTHTVHSRMFSGQLLDLPEDAATGSAAGPLAAYLARHRLIPAGETILNEQGDEMGRPSLLHMRVMETGRVRVGGQSVIVGEGVMVA